MTGKELKDLVSTIPDDAEVRVSDGFGDPELWAEASPPKRTGVPRDYYILTGKPVEEDEDG